MLGKQKPCLGLIVIFRMRMAGHIIPSRVPRQTIYGGRHEKATHKIFE